MPEATTQRRAIVVLDYDPTWPALFEVIRLRLDALLSGLVLEISHIGSTAVPGLCAKPKIDVDVVLKDTASIDPGITRLQAAGYAFHGDMYRDGMWAFTSGRGSYGERIYLCAPGTATHENRLLFRDYLRNHPEAADKYGRLKRRLAGETADDWAYYTGSKGPFVADIVARARRR
jgi:GrpB-like predicted nucleotidyltransferase (UPF0157 family)